MALGRWQATIQDEDGNIIPSVYIEVRRESTGTPLAVLYSDRDGTVSIGNPFQADAEGFAAFHVVGGSYKVRAYLGDFERIFRYVPVGTNAERDFGTIFTPRGAWDMSVTYSIGDYVSYESDAEVFAFVSSVDDNLGNEPQFASGNVPQSDAYWTVLGLIEAPGTPGEDGAPGSSNTTGTSASSVAIGTGSKSFTVVEADRGWLVGTRLRLASAADPSTHWMEGVVTAYADPALTVLVDIVNGSGSKADWNINITGEPASRTPAYREVTAAGDITVLSSDDIIGVNKTVGAATNVNLGLASARSGNPLVIKDVKKDAGTNNITPVASGGELIDGLAAADWKIQSDGGSLKLLPISGGWLTIP